MEVIVDSISTGFLILATEYFYRNGLKPLAWMISVIPIIFVLTLSLIIIVTRLQLENDYSHVRLRTEPSKLSVSNLKKIQDKINEF
jgi:hypothetical protein